MVFHYFFNTWQNGNNHCNSAQKCNFCLKDIKVGPLFAKIVSKVVWKKSRKIDRHGSTIILKTLVLLRFYRHSLLSKINKFLNILFFNIYIFTMHSTFHVEIKEIYIFPKKQNRNLIPDLNAIQKNVINIYKN